MTQTFKLPTSRLRHRPSVDKSGKVHRTLLPWDKVIGGPTMREVVAAAAMKGDK